MLPENHCHHDHRTVICSRLQEFKDHFQSHGSVQLFFRGVALLIQIALLLLQERALSVTCKVYVLMLQSIWSGSKVHSVIVSLPPLYLPRQHSYFRTHVLLCRTMAAHWGIVSLLGIFGVFDFCRSAFWFTFSCTHFHTHILFLSNSFMAWMLWFHPELFVQLPFPVVIAIFFSIFCSSMSV